MNKNETEPLMYSSPGFLVFLLTYVTKSVILVNDICRKGDAYAKASQMPQDRTTAGLSQLFT